MEEKTINKIEDVEVGDIAYFEGVEDGVRVVSVDPHDRYRSRLEVEAPEEYRPFNIFGDISVWLRNSCFEYAMRPPQNKLGKKRIPAVQERQEHIFETQKGIRVIYGGLSRGWRVESFLGDKRLLELLDPSEFPLKDITEEES